MSFEFEDKTTSNFSYMQQPAAASEGFLIKMLKKAGVDESKITKYLIIMAVTFFALTLFVIFKFVISSGGGAEEPTPEELLKMQELMNLQAPVE